MKEFDEEVVGLRKFLGGLMQGLNGALLLDDESKAILETQYLKAQSEILNGYQQVIARRLKAIESGKTASKKISVE